MYISWCANWISLKCYYHPAYYVALVVARTALLHNVAVCIYTKSHLTYLLSFFFRGTTAPVGLGLLNVEASRSHSDAPHLIRFLWTSDQTDAETSTWKHTLVTRDRRTSMPPEDFEPAIPARERPQTDASGRTAIGLPIFDYWQKYIP